MDPTSHHPSSPDLAGKAAPRPGRPSLIYCGFCSALNPSTNHYCAACGSTLVDAFHASEGLRVYERADSASPLIEIVPAGTELEIVEDPAAPEDFVRVRLPHGRLGYIRLQEVEALADATASTRRAPDINTNARGCITSGGALGALALLVATSTLGLVMLYRTDTAGSGILALIFCFGVAPLLLLVVGLYLYARSREERLAAEEADAEPQVTSPGTDRPGEVAGSG